jgi:CRP/FNR family cyclic AMP-dependent transcriptional regulator
VPVSPGEHDREEDRVAKPRLETALSTVPLFDGLSKRQLRKVGSAAQVVECTSGHPIVREGEPGDAFFVVLSGQAKVTVKGRTVSRCLPGDHFGEISLLDGGPRAATVASETPMTMLVIRRNDFQKVLAADPRLILSLMESLARTIRRVDRSLAR